MADDWRLRIELTEQGRAHALTERLAAGGSATTSRRCSANRLAVSADRAERVRVCRRPQAGAGRRGQDPRRSPPSTTGTSGSSSGTGTRPLRNGRTRTSRCPPPTRSRSQSTRELIAQSARSPPPAATPITRCGSSCPSHRETVKLDKRLHGEGFPTVRRWKYLLVGAADEDSANALAEGSVPRRRRAAP